MTVLTKKVERTLGKVIITQEDLNFDEEYILFDGAKNITKWYIGPSEYEDYDEQTEQFLYDFICTQAPFPIYLTFEPYNDLTEKIESTFKKGTIPFSLQVEGIKNKSFPVFIVTINDPLSLKLVLEETFWIAASNQFFAFSFSNHTTYKLAYRKGFFGRKTPMMLPCYQIENPSTIMKIWHDGQGFELYTNDIRYSTVEMLTKHSPNGTIVDSES